MTMLVDTPTSSSLYSNLLENISNPVPKAETLKAHTTTSSTPLAMTNSSPDCSHIQLKQDNYPNIPFWTRRQWDKHVQRLKDIGNWDAGNRAEDIQPSVALGFITNEDGASITEAQAAEVCDVARSIFCQLAESKPAPSTWSRAPMGSMLIYRRDMYKVFPDLMLCESHWKVQYIATAQYPSWYRNPKNRISRTEDTDDASTNNYKRKGTSESNHSVSHKKQKKNPVQVSHRSLAHPQAPSELPCSPSHVSHTQPKSHPPIAEPASTRAEDLLGMWYYTYVQYS